MKSYTDLKQSKNLAKILPLESADMRYGHIAPYETSVEKYDGGYDEIPHSKDFLTKHPYFFEDEYDGELSCWSLAALLDVLESEIDGEKGETYQLNIEKDGTQWNVWYKEQYDEAEPIVTPSAEDLIDACVETILKLNELNLL